MHLAVAGFGTLYLLLVVKPFEWGKKYESTMQFKIPVTCKDAHDLRFAMGLFL